MPVIDPLLYALSSFAFALLYFILRFHSDSRSSIPFVTALVPGGIQTGLKFFLRRPPFLEHCRLKYGPIYRIPCGWKNMIVLSTSSSINTFFLTNESIFDAKDAHFRALIALGSSGNRAQLAAPVHGQFMPAFGRALSRPSISKELTANLHSEMKNHLLKLLLQDKGDLKLAHLIGRTLYDSISTVFFGPTFPLDETWDDFVTLDKAMSMLMSPLSFIAISGMRARRRLLKVIKNYIVHNDTFIDEKVSAVASAFQASKDHSLPLHEQAVCFLSIFWALHSNLQRSVWWLTALVLVNSEAHKLLAEEVRYVIQTQYRDDLDSFISTKPEIMFQNFPLVDSAVNEALRLCTLPGSVRVALTDTMYPRDDGSLFMIHRGEMIMADIKAIHTDESYYPDAKTFRVDRFMKPNDAPKIKSWGGGAHICKGRSFSHHFMKLWIVLLLDMFNIETSALKVPEQHPGSWTVVADPVGDISVKFSLRTKY